MDQGLFSAPQLLESRLTLLRDLAASLEQAQTAVLDSDLAGIDGESRRQRIICQAIGELEAQALRSPALGADGERVRHWPLKLPEGPHAPLAQKRWNGLAEQCAEAEMRVVQLNRAYGALLRRARRTLEVFRRVLAAPAATYTPPPSRPVALASSCEEARHGQSL